MEIDITKIGILGISFSRGFDQTWFNLWRKDDGYSMDLYQDVEDDESDDDEIVQTETIVSLEQGEEMIRRIFEDGKIEEWEASYSGGANPETDLSWTLDVDDLQEQDMLFSSGNGKLPPRELMMGVIDAIRTGEPNFARCFQEFR